MLTASDAAKCLDSICSLQTVNILNPRQQQFQHRPSMLHLKSALKFGVPVQQSNNSNAMDIYISALDKADAMTAIQRICWDKKLCFHCLQCFDSSHWDSAT